MELHEENSFKVKSYTNAYLNIRKMPQELSEVSTDDIEKLPGIGKAISAKISELLETGTLQNIQKLLDITPEGIVQLLEVKGLGAKKIRTIWQDLGVESVGELLYAINENRLVDLKGFGTKTQNNIKDQLEYFVESADKQLYAYIVDEAEELITLLRTQFSEGDFYPTGEWLRKSEVISSIDILSTWPLEKVEDAILSLDPVYKKEDVIKLNGIPIHWHHFSEDLLHYKRVQLSCGNDFFDQLNIPEAQYNSEEEVFSKNNWPVFIPEFRENENAEHLNDYPGSENIIEESDIKGTIHNHSTYSDGMNSMEEMLVAAAEKGYEYFVITDHSKSAFYANGLQEERLMQQLDEIRVLDQKYDNIKFFSGIESDILSNGDLDYPDSVLSELDVVVASIHSHLKMNIDKATHRLIKAIENPYTSILGHPTGRLLLSRKAYPVDFKKVIDACSANGVAIEINANPVRLDLDWRHVQYARSKDVLISINPDAHNVKGLDHTYFGVCAARKSALTKTACLNAMDLEEFEEWLMDQHQKRI